MSDLLTPTTSFEDTSVAAIEDEQGITPRWWEAEAQQTLECTDSIKDIQLICKYVPFDRPDAASLALSKQWKPRLYTLWMATCTKYNRHWDLLQVLHRSPIRIAESIIRLLIEGQKITSLPRPRHYWTPPSPNSTPSESAEKIAESLDDYFRCLFHNICLRDWVKAALGYNTTAVTSLLGECQDTRVALYESYKQKKFPTSSYKLVEERLRLRNPLAHWTVSNHMAHPSEALHSFFRCFHALCARQEGDFMCWVRQLAVLAERFQQNILATDVDRNKDLSSGFSLLHQISCKDVRALASRIKEEDSTYFRTLDRDNFFDKIGGLNTRWQFLSENARAGAIVDSDMGEPIGKLAKLLHEKRDYQSMTALLTGLRQAKVYPPHSLFALVDPDNNYANYREQWTEKPGIPFLFPHVKEIQYARDPQSKLDEFLESWSYESEEPDEAPPTLVQGLRESFNRLGCS